jgi:hypothetical protein
MFINVLLRTNSEALQRFCERCCPKRCRRALIRGGLAADYERDLKQVKHLIRAEQRERERNDPVYKRAKFI